MAAGSTGLLAHSLRGALTWVLLGFAAVAGCRGRKWSVATIAWLSLAVIAAIAMTALRSPAVNVLAAAVLLAGIATGWSGSARSVLRLAALSIAVLAVFVQARTSIPLVWLAGDLVGQGIGRCAELITGQPLWVGATFAGLDFLAVMGALYAGWLVTAGRPRWPRAI
ncbi:MAG: hypothetical protein AMJ81_14000, partial [Phycisphaerae bacterium SM23_33]